ncbi:MAG: galactonate dehydratase [Candidatus Lumbricidophila eiseniae]|uniref:Galactonate dehydratase n=1 Tax=Candidatus Lumbricidiphila eiseniae TaxID=1969409 RepID=A0A2A6FNP5_9MICO|nr:MAG: galactonate dehydratase [Candidatus Lumbricidophila eiseniae]
MKITSIDTFEVDPRWLFVRIDTDSGIVGWGEATLEGSSDVVTTAVKAFAERLVGTEPRRIEDAWQRSTRGGFYRGGPVFSSAIAGIDMALWDILGRSLRVPVHQLLGGHVRDEVRVYGWIGGDSPADVAGAARAQREAGLTAIKMNGSPQRTHLPSEADDAEVIERAALVREALGPELDFAIDFHGRLSAPAARRLLPQLEPYHPLFVEEPVLTENNHANLARLISSSPVPIATGERMYSRWDVLPALEAGVAVLQPDLAHAGGISEVRRIAALAETFDVAIAPHCPLGPLALAACLQVDFATPNFLIQEQSMGIHYNTTADLLDFVQNPEVFAFTSGSIARPLGDGLGVEINEDAVRRSAAKHQGWRTPIWDHTDGSFAEW